MWSRRPLALLAAVAAVAVPAPALAQEPDLLAQDPPELEDSLPTPEPEETPEPEPEPEDDPADPGDTGGDEAEDPLPATGGETGLIAALGAGMLLTGSGLRVRLRARS